MFGRSSCFHHLHFVPFSQPSASAVPCLLLPHSFLPHFCHATFLPNCGSRPISSGTLYFGSRPISSRAPFSTPRPISRKRRVARHVLATTPKHGAHTPLSPPTAATARPTAAIAVTSRIFILGVHGAHGPAAATWIAERAQEPGPPRGRGVTSHGYTATVTPPPPPPPQPPPQSLLPPPPPPPPCRRHRHHHSSRPHHPHRRRRHRRRRQRRRRRHRHRHRHRGGATKARPQGMSCKRALWAPIWVRPPGHPRGFRSHPTVWEIRSGDQS